MCVFLFFSSGSVCLYKRQYIIQIITVNSNMKSTGRSSTSNHYKKVAKNSRDQSFTVYSGLHSMNSKTNSKRNRMFINEQPNKELRQDSKKILQLKDKLSNMQYSELQQISQKQILYHNQTSRICHSEQFQPSLMVSHINSQKQSKELKGASSSRLAEISSIRESSEDQIQNQQYRGRHDEDQNRQTSENLDGFIQTDDYVYTQNQYLNYPNRPPLYLNHDHIATDSNNNTHKKLKSDSEIIHQNEYIENTNIEQPNYNLKLYKLIGKLQEIVQNQVHLGEQVCISRNLQSASRTNSCNRSSNNRTNGTNLHSNNNRTRKSIQTQHTPNNRYRNEDYQTGISNSYKQINVGMGSSQQLKPNYNNRSINKKILNRQQQRQSLSFNKTNKYHYNNYEDDDNDEIGVYARSYNNSMPLHPQYRQTVDEVQDNEMEPNVRNRGRTNSYQPQTYSGYNINLNDVSYFNHKNKNRLPYQPISKQQPYDRMSEDIVQQQYSDHAQQQIHRQTSLGTNHSLGQQFISRGSTVKHAKSIHPPINYNNINDGHKNKNSNHYQYSYSNLGDPNKSATLNRESSSKRWANSRQGPSGPKYINAKQMIDNSSDNSPSQHHSKSMNFTQLFKNMESQKKSNNNNNFEKDKRESRDTHSLKDKSKSKTSRSKTNIVPKSNNIIPKYIKPPSNSYKNNSSISNAKTANVNMSNNQPIINAPNPLVKNNKNRLEAFVSLRAVQNFHRAKIVQIISKEKSNYVYTASADYRLCRMHLQSDQYSSYSKCNVDQLYRHRGQITSACLITAQNCDLIATVGKDSYLKYINIQQQKQIVEQCAAQSYKLTNIPNKLLSTSNGKVIIGYSNSLQQFSISRNTTLKEYYLPDGVNNADNYTLLTDNHRILVGTYYNLYELDQRTGKYVQLIKSSREVDRWLIDKHYCNSNRGYYYNIQSEIIFSDDRNNFQSLSVHKNIGQIVDYSWDNSHINTNICSFLYAPYSQQQLTLGTFANPSNMKYKVIDSYQNHHKTNINNSINVDFNKRVEGLQRSTQYNIVRKIGSKYFLGDITGNLHIYSL